MIFKNLLQNQRFFFSQVRKQLKWKFNPNGVQIFYKDPRSISNIVFYVTPNIKISQFLMASEIKQKDVTYPQGINHQTDLVGYLLQKQIPKALQIKYGGQTYFLRNRAWYNLQILLSDEVTKDIIQTIKDSKSIYQHLQKFIQNNKAQHFFQRCDYLTRYYLKLQAECYCKAKKVNLNDLLTLKIKEDIINYLNLKNQINSQQNLEEALKQQNLLKQSIFETQLRIQELNRFYEARQNWYKRMAILITFIHLASFGYMIFAVDWLGWDIIQPLTYTVGVLYTLLGIRFYRKYKVSRNSQNIREALFKMIMPPEKRVLLSQNKTRLQIQGKELRKKKQEQQLLKNKLAFRTSLIQSLKNTI